MSHRETHRVRTSQHDRIDPEASSRVMSREWRSAIPRRAVPEDDRVARTLAAPPRDAREEVADERSADAIRRELERSRIIPVALTLACAHAPVGKRCYVNGICGERAARATVAKFSALA